ncbi:MAG: alpha-L-arabinofuranosidase C-terminal domain-containing protein, partial [Bacteroides sp.]
LSEALYLTALERNGDVVSMSSYAPLLAKEKHTQWSPDLIYFNNQEVKPTTGYYVQQLYGQNAGDTYISSLLSTDNGNEGVNKRIAVSIVKDSRTNDIIIKLVNLLPVRVDTKVNLSGMGSL